MSRSEKSSQSTDSGHNNSYTVKTEDGVTIAHQPIVGSPDDGGVGWGA